MVLMHKNYLFSSVFSGFLRNPHGLMVPAQPPYTHPGLHLMQKEPIDFLNLPRRGTISGVQNVTLYCKTDTAIQLFQWLYKWSLAQGLYKTLDPLFLYSIQPEISTPEKSVFLYSVLSNKLVTFPIVRVPIQKKRKMHFTLSG